MKIKFIFVEQDFIYSLEFEEEINHQLMMNSISVDDVINITEYGNGIRIWYKATR